MFLNAITCYHIALARRLYGPQLANEVHMKSLWAELPDCFVCHANRTSKRVNTRRLGKHC